MSERGRDWRTILLAAGAICGACLAVVAAASMVFYAALAPTGLSLGRETASPLDVVVPATAVMFMAILALPAASSSIRYLATGVNVESRPPLLRIWEGLLLIPPWVGASFLAGYLVGKQPWQWLTPLLYLVAIAIPVYFVVRLVAGGLSVGSVRRFWGLFSVGMAAGPGFAIFIELCVVLIFAVGAGVYLAVNPGQLAAIRELMSRLNTTTDMEQTMKVLGPLLKQPFVFFAALLFFSGLAPIIEEAAKSIAVWTVFDRLDSGVQGFLAGALSGAGFGLLESLFASATPDPSWAATLLIRGGSSMMHIAAASLTGWGIARFHLTRRLAPLLGGYAGALILHSLWNAAVISIAFGGLNLAITSTARLGATALTAFGVVLLGLLCILIPVGLAIVNGRMRAAPADSSSSPAGSPPPQDAI